MNSLIRSGLVKRALLYLALAAGAGLMSGCGGGGGGGGGKTFTGDTSVTVMVTSTANDRLSNFSLDFNSITLTSQSGKTVSLLPQSEHVEFIHLDGKAEPLFTVSVPEDTYTAASAVIGPARFTCQGGESGGTVTDVYAYGNTPDSQVTVNLPAPITVSGSGMVLSLDLLAAESASWGGSTCATEGGTVYSITPTFDLTTSASPSEKTVTGLAGIITSVGGAGGGLTVCAADGSESGIQQDGSSLLYNCPTWQVGTAQGTVFQGVASASALTAGMAVDLDATLQDDGSLAATRVAVYDSDTSNLSFSLGPLVVVLSSAPILGASAQLAGGMLFTGGLDVSGFAQGVSYGGAKFEVSGQFANVGKLPFPAAFNAASMAAGQTLLITSHGTSVQPWPIYIPATTITLMPQTINGTVAAVSTEGGFNTYTVALPAYDLFPQFAVQDLQTTVLSDPSTVIVYADSGTRMLNTKPIAVGSTVRFNGIVFNDNGTLRMDCAQVTDGVAE